MMTRQEQFDKFDREHPEFWDAFCDMAWTVMEKGYIRYSARTIFEVLRWHSEMNSGGHFKIQNNWIPFYAKKFNSINPGFFSTRERG